MPDERGETDRDAERLLSLSLPFSPEAPGRARRAVTALEIGVGEARDDDLRLLVSELVTNSLRHARSADDPGARIELTVYRRRDAVRIEVADPGPGFTPGERRSVREGETGWGFRLVEALSDGWGVSTDRGTRVWFEMQEHSG